MPRERHAGRHQRQQERPEALLAEGLERLVGGRSLRLGAHGDVHAAGARAPSR